MATFKKYEIGQSFKLELDFETFLPSHHLSRGVENIVSELDISAIEATYKEKGQNPYDPRMLLSIIFYGYMTGARSGRELERLCRQDLVFIYLSKCYSLGKSTINDFRKYHYPHFSSLFLQVLQKCEAAGLVDPSISIIDGSKMEANSSKKRSKTKSQFEKWQKCLEEDISELSSDYKTLANNEIIKNLKAKQKLKEKIDAIIESYDEGEEERLKNQSDPDSPIMKTKKGNCDTSYNPQVGCTENQIITYAHVTTAGNDKAQLIPALKGIQENTQKPIKSALADADYGNYESFEFMDNENITGYVPYRNMTTDFKKQPFHISHFNYDEQNDEYTCPQGKKLSFKAIKKTKKLTYKVYKTQACKDCPVRELCTKAKQRHIHRETRETLREQMKQRLQSQEGKQMYIRRMHPVEAIFGHFKRNLGYTHFLLRGLEKVNAEFMLMCLTQNLRKLLVKNSIFFVKLVLLSIRSCHTIKIPDMSNNFFKNIINNNYVFKYKYYL